jgi:histidinol dehydrogenase
VCNACCDSFITSCSSFDVHRLLHSQVEPIVQSVRERGDAAVKEFTEKFDRATVDTVCVRIEVRDALITQRCMALLCV